MCTKTEEYVSRKTICISYSSNSTRQASPPPRSPSPPSRPATPSSRPATPSSRSTTPARSLTEADITTGKKGKKEWPRQYKISKENIAKGITTKLDNKEYLTTGERRILLETIYNDVTKYKGRMYPTSEMYEVITDGLIREYPHLLSLVDCLLHLLELIGRIKSFLNLEVPGKVLTNIIQRYRSEKEKKDTTSRSCIRQWRWREYIHVVPWKIFT